MYICYQNTHQQRLTASDLKPKFLWIVFTVTKQKVFIYNYVVDVNGKVVHLVQRAPPSENQGAPRAPSPMPTHSRTGSFPFRNRLDNIYLGSMQIPATLLETTAPPPTHRLAASRLNVAKR